jgi:diguanylate cyclase (GGDEF)-like protein
LSHAKRLVSDAAWEHLCAEAEAILAPTMQLAHQLSHAYDQIRQQSDALETFTHGRTDPLTGVGNARALDQHLRVLLTAAAHGIGEFNIALVSLDHATKTDRRLPASILPALPKLAAVIRTCMRDTDFVARYGDEEFVIVMPHTSTAGAAIFAERLQRRVVEELGASVCCGLAESQPGDDTRSLFARADSALYSARAAGSNRLFVHSGGHIREHHAGASPPSGGARETQAPAKSHVAGNGMNL